VFRVRAPGDASIRLQSLDARDHDNRRVPVDGGPATGNPAALPHRVALGFAGPNPFRDATAFELALPERGIVSLALYGIDGRRVRSLAGGALEAGVHRIAWDGRDDSGRDVPAGMYFVRLTAGSARLGRAIVRVK